MTDLKARMKGSASTQRRVPNVPSLGMVGCFCHTSKDEVRNNRGCGRKSVDLSRQQRCRVWVQNLHWLASDVGELADNQVQLGECRVTVQASAGSRWRGG
jgi:hypothetical protein